MIKITKDGIKYIVTKWSTMSVPDIAKKLGISAATVYTLARHIRKQGIKLNRHKTRRLSQIINEAIKELK